MSILPKALSLVLKTLALLSDQKNRQALQEAGQFFLQLLSPGQTESQVDASSQLASTCDSVWSAFKGGEFDSERSQL